MKITFTGDWHGYTIQAVEIIRYAHERGSDHIFQVGDFGIWEGDDFFLHTVNSALKERGMRLYFVDGNHENFPVLYKYPLDQKTGMRTIRSSIYHLPRGWRGYINPSLETVTTTPEDEESISVLAFGGAYSIDRNFRTLNVDYWQEELATKAEVDAAVSDGPADILIMHDCPDPAPCPTVDDPLSQIRAKKFYGAENVDASYEHRKLLTPLLTKVKPKLLVHGHYHDAYRGRYKHPNNGTFTTIVSLADSLQEVHKSTTVIDVWSSDDVWLTHIR